MNYYYVFPTQKEAQACLDFINGSGWFPIVGQRNGVPDKTAQATVSWGKSPIEMLSGEWAVPYIPKARAEFLQIPQAEIDSFLATYAKDFRELSADAFPVVEEP